MVLSALCFTVLNSIVRYVEHLPTLQLVFFRSIGSSILGIIILKRMKVPFWGTHKKLLILRGILGVTSIFLFYEAIKLMPIGTAVSLRYLAPVFASILAVIYLKEKIKPLQWVFIFCAFLGVVILKGFDTRISTEGLIIILATAFVSALVYIVIRKIGTSENPIVIVNYFMFISTGIGIIGCCFQWIQPEAHEWLFLCSMGVFGFIAQYFMTRAFQIAEANFISPFKYVEAIFTLLAGWLIFGENQSVISILGITMIILSLISIVWIKSQSLKTSP